MRIRPRDNLLEIWRGLAEASYQDGKWIWGGRYESNSVSDAQHLLCLMFPATEIASFALATPDRTDENTVAALSRLGGALDIPVLLVRVLHEYLDEYTDDQETPVFSGGSHFVTPDPKVSPSQAQQSTDVVESFATSMTLMLATLSFARTFRRVVNRDELVDDLQRLEERASKRLTAAMVGLLRSFTVNTFDAVSPLGQLLLRSVNQANRPERRVITELRDELRDVIAGVRDEIRLGSGQGKGRDLAATSTQLFECGWSWGVIHGTGPIDFADAGVQAPGVAADEPYLYFTMVALDAIADLFTERTRRGSLLNDQQQRLAAALQIRWDLTQRYWSVLADFGPGSWPLEDLPWRTTDDVESDYLTLLVAGVAMRDLIERRADDVELERLGQVLIELANRGRITRRPMAHDHALTNLHDPGFRLGLVSFDDDPDKPSLAWPIQDFAAVLLKRTIRVASMFKDTRMHTQMLRLADDLWQHLESRRLRTTKAKNVWDQPQVAFPMVTQTYEEPSWQMTVRVVESLVIAANLVTAEPLRSDRLQDIARDMISEADHLLDKELLIGPHDPGPAMRRTVQSLAARLQRSKEILTERPGSSLALVKGVLEELEMLKAAREDSTWAR